MQSILLTIKRLIGIHDADESFDMNIVVCINSALSTLCQLGFGPEEGFVVTSESNVWSELIGNRKDAEFIKTYIMLKTKLQFDPPTNSSAMSAIDRQISELEWRIVNMPKKGVSP